MKILVVFGTRPEAIKMAPLIKEFQKYPDSFETIVCVSGQHRELLDQVLRIFELTPDYDLNIMRSGQDLYDVTSRVLLGMKDVIVRTKPDYILVHGDTSTSMAVSLAAFYQQIPVAHIEAGLRTNNKYSPWPEEMNRQITGRIATYHFAPTLLNKRNLEIENINPEAIIVTGNTGVDALFMALNKLKDNHSLIKEIASQLEKCGLNKSLIKKYTIDYEANNSKLILITGHRRENFGQGFLSICEAIKELSILFPDYDFIYPMHLNPNVRNAVKAVFNDTLAKNPMNVSFIEPLDYLPFVFLMEKSSILLTDSGGVQEEAPSLGKPVLVMRNITERTEALEARTIRLVGTDKNIIIREFIETVIENENPVEEMKPNPYGDGKASERIVNFFRSLE